MQKKKSSLVSELTPKLWSVLRKKYSIRFFKDDLFAGITVGLISLPLAVAFAIGSGVAPERGIYTAVVAGFLISFLGGSRFQIGGPTGAFVVVLYGIVQKEGYEGLLLASLLGGLFLCVSSLLRLGSLIKYIPYPLVTGFTTGIGVLLFSSQVVDFLGLQVPKVPAQFFLKWQVIFSSLSTFDFTACVLAISTLFLMMIIRRFLPFIPWGIGSIALATIVSQFLHLPLQTISSSFGEIKSSWSLPNFSAIHFSRIFFLIPDGFTIAFLAGVESLLCAVIADGMAGTKHKSNCELMAQGVANIGSVLLGGIPATGAIARTASNVKLGAKSPIAGMIHALTVLVIFLFFAPIIGKIPLASLAALLVMVAWNMSEIDRFIHLFKAPKSDVLILLTAFFLTIFTDLTIAVLVGVLLSAFLFVKKMSDTVRILSHSQAQEEKEAFRQDLHPADKIKEIPNHIAVYNVEGPLFFGVAGTVKSLLTQIQTPPKVYILRLHKVPLIDATAMEALRELHLRCQKEGVILFLSGVRESLFKALQKFGLVKQIGSTHIFHHFSEALEEAQKNEWP